MTVSYNSEISSVSSFNFLRLMCRWRGSIWKSVLSELMMWITSYISLALFYHLVLFPKRFDEDPMRGSNPRQPD
ncbi:Protein CBG10746 [Caenorhabditis briggsae]|uniref:Bestrophin homolog n=1 Tax=Caenorhabditis briggsae TaxID=6238 RepID=A8XBP9_CAEBR|nr:Protein CBG10746 [Caenorhabditis briggsae]CAP30065.1 Protein CBG10746 [Caenorhabditis briggsae]